MAREMHLWQDARGYLHSTQQSAEDADRLFAETSEREARRAIVRQMLVGRINRRDGRRLLASDVSGVEAADWLIANWPTLKAIGYAYRMDDLVPAGEASVSEQAA
jgi:hypothetical protein